jgi:hypothetical protein
MASSPAAQGSDQTTTYRLAPLVTVRFVGLYLVLLAFLVFVATGLVLGLDLPGDLLVGLALVGLIGLGVLAWWLNKRAFVLRAAPDGYEVRMIRKAGVKIARWNQVEDAITATRHGVEVVELRLKSGQTTTLPVELLAVDKNAFVKDLQGYLQRGQLKR